MVMGDTLLESWGEKGRDLNTYREIGEEGDVKKRKNCQQETQILWGEEEVKKEPCVSKKFWWVQPFGGCFYGDPATSTGLPQQRHRLRLVTGFVFWMTRSELAISLLNMTGLFSQRF
jgi:hypothetical protein